MDTLWKGLAITVLLTSTAMAAKTPVNANVSISIRALQEQIQVTPEGERKVELVEPNNVFSGDEVVYAITYENKGKTPSDQVVITKVIPEDMKLREGSAQDSKANVSYSVDGGKTYKRPEVLEIQMSDGQKRIASPVDYTHIQWEILSPVAPGAQGMVGYRAISE